MTKSDDRAGLCGYVHVYEYTHRRARHSGLKYSHTHTWHIMTRMKGPGRAVMNNLIDTRANTRAHTN